MATVYLALLRAEKGFSRLVALKVLRDRPGIEPVALRQLFAHEARVSARCHHRNVVQIQDVCDLDGKPALCMEYLDGQTYRQVKTRAAKTGALPLFEQLRILAEAAHGLHHVHTLKDYDGRPLGLVHCDVSPENVFITYDGQIKLLDFGIAQAHGDRAPPPGFRGKLSYLAPEVIRGGPVGARADVFALGAMLWEAVSAAPFSGGPTVDVRTKVRTRLEGGEANIRGVQPGTPEALAAIIDRALALDPGQRFSDAASFANALEDCLQQARPQPSAQSLSRVVSPMFDRERARQRAIVDPQLQLADQWDREHESATTPGSLIDDTGPVPYTSARRVPPFVAPGQPEPSHDPFSYNPPYTSPADSVSPDVGSRLRINHVAVFAFVAAIGVLGGALLAWNDSKKSEPVTVGAVPPSPSAPAASAPVAASSPAAAQVAVRPRASAAGAESAKGTQVELHDDASAQACVTTTRGLRDGLLQNLARDLVREQARADRHRERRARRRAAQCAAGRTDKC